jgi:hypothetical protein
VEDVAGNRGKGIASTTWRRSEGDSTEQSGPFAGSYRGLLEADLPAHATSGAIALTLTRTGTFSASGLYGGTPFTFHGALDGDGRFSGVARGRAGTLGINLALATETGANAITGTVTSAFGLSDLIADRLLYSRKTPAPLRGKYVALLPAAQAVDLSTLPSGDGFAVVTILPNGQLLATGQFADGTGFSQSTSLAGTDEWPFYAALDHGKTSAVGRLVFRTRPGLSDLDGTLTWFRSAHKKPRFFHPHLLSLSRPSARFTPPRAEGRSSAPPDNRSR